MRRLRCASSFLVDGVQPEDEASSGNAIREIDDDAAHRRVVGMEISRQRPCEGDLDVADMVRCEGVMRDNLEIGGIDRIVDGTDHAHGFGCAAAHHDTGAKSESGRMQPENARTQRTTGFRRGRRGGDKVAAIHKQFAIERDSDRLTGSGVLHGRKPLRAQARLQST